MSTWRRLINAMSIRRKKPDKNIVSSNSRISSMVQNFHLIWLDEGIDETDDDDCRNSITELRQIVNNVNTFTDADECIHFISSIKQEKVVMITSGALGETIVPLVHDKSHVSTIYIFCGNKARHQRWTKQWSKVKGVFTNMTSICEALKQTVQEHDQNLMSIGFVEATDENSTKTLDEMNRSFMYTQILKEILLTIDFEQGHFKEFIAYCREKYARNSTELEDANKFAHEYRDDLSIWWYTYDSFLYGMVNTALRLMEIDLIIKMGFYIRDLHDRIVELHSEQYDARHQSKPFIVYRSQSLSQADFDQLMKTKGGLISFNNFLSTSKNRNVSLRFARQPRRPELVSIMFVMTIDPSISSTPFANVTDESEFADEEEILFSMHSVFRIGEIKQIDENDPFWQVKLTLTNENDPQLSALTERMREETKGSTGWLRLGSLMVKVAQYDKAECLYQTLLAQKIDDEEKGNIFHQLGLTKYYQGEYTDATAFYKRSLQIRQKTLSSQDLHLAECYNDIGLVYQKMADYTKALEYHEKALDIRQKALLRNSPDLADSCNNIGSTYDHIGEDSKALLYYEKAQKIYQKTLPSNHPHLATSYNNIGLVYSKIGDRSKALSCLERALEIYRKILPPNHPDLAASYNNIGLVYSQMGEYLKALSYHERSHEILKRTLSSTHPHIAASYTNIGGIYGQMNKYPEALSSHEKALQIYQKTLPANHPDLAGCYGYIGIVSLKIGDHSKAISYCELALKIAEDSLPPNHPQRHSYKKNLEIVKKNSSCSSINKDLK